MSKAIRTVIDAALAILLGVVLLGVYWVDHHSPGPQERDPNEPEKKAAIRKMRLAVTAGGFEDMVSLLETLGDGYDIETIDEDMLLDSEKTKKFEVVFLACAQPKPRQKGPDG